MIYNFVHIPKVAGISFFQLVENNESFNILGHTKAYGEHCIAFVRNPYDRIVSTYFYLVNGGRQWKSDLHDQQTLLKYKDFKDFILHIRKDELIEEILHVKPMSYFVCDEENNIIVEKIFKIEEIEKIDEFLATLEIPPLTSIRVNTSVHEHYMSYLDEEIIKEINIIYELDFKLFNYIML